jgi:uncharacterized protein (TIGR02117 family)
MRKTVLLIVIVLLCGACAGAPPPAEPVPPVGADKTVYLIHNGWHSGIVVQTSDLPPDVLPERADFPRVRSLEVGWGDRDFYMARGIGVWTSLKAAFIPTASVLHIAGFSEPVTEFFPDGDIIEFRLSAAALDRLGRYIHDSLDRRESARAHALGPGLYGTSRFYPAIGYFHMFNTCHTWTAGALRAAGYPFSASPTERGLLVEARRLGRPIQTTATE